MKLTRLHLVYANVGTKRIDGLVTREVDGTEFEEIVAVHASLLAQYEYLQGKGLLKDVYFESGIDIGKIEDHTNFSWNFISRQSADAFREALPSLTDYNPEPKGPSFNWSGFAQAAKEAKSADGADGSTI